MFRQFHILGLKVTFKIPPNLNAMGHFPGLPWTPEVATCLLHFSVRVSWEEITTGAIWNSSGSLPGKCPIGWVLLRSRTSYRRWTLSVLSPICSWRVRVTKSLKKWGVVQWIMSKCSEVTSACELTFTTNSVNIYLISGDFLVGLGQFFLIDWYTLLIG